MTAAPVADPEWQPAVILMDNGQGTHLQRMGLFLRWLRWTLPPSSEDVEGGYFLRVPLSDLATLTAKNDLGDAASPSPRAASLRESHYKSYLKQTWHSLSRAAESISCDPGPGCSTSVTPTGLSAFEVNDRYLSVSAWPVPQLMAAILPHRAAVKLVMVVDNPARQVLDAATVLGEGARKWVKDELALLQACLQGDSGRVTFGGDGFPSAQHCEGQGSDGPRPALASALEACLKGAARDGRDHGDVKGVSDGGNSGDGNGDSSKDKGKSASGDDDGNNNGNAGREASKAADGPSVGWYPWLSPQGPDWSASDAFAGASSNTQAGGGDSVVSPGTRRGLVVEGLFGLVLAQWRCAGFSPSQMLLLPRSLVERDLGQALRRVADFLGQPLEFKNAAAQERLDEMSWQGVAPRGSPDDVKLRAELDAFFAPHSASLMRALTSHGYGGNMSELAGELGISDDAVRRAEGEEGGGDENRSNPSKGSPGNGDDAGGGGRGGAGSGDGKQSGGAAEGDPDGSKGVGAAASSKGKGSGRKVGPGLDVELVTAAEDERPRLLYEDASYIFLFLIVLGATLLASVLYTVLFGTSDNVFKFTVAETVGERGTVSEALSDALTAHVRALQALAYRLTSAGMQPWDVHVTVRAPAAIIGPRDDMWRPTHETSFEVDELPDKTGSIEYQDLPSSSSASSASIAGSTIMLETELVMRALTHPHMHAVEEHISAGFKVVGSIGMAPVEITAPSDRKQGGVGHVMMFLRKHFHHAH